MTARDLSPPTVRNGAPPASTPPGVLPLGTELAGRYRILELLGEGGMGVVYRARDRSLELDVALKVLPRDVADDPDMLAFFRNEVRVARMVTHPNVCRLHDLEETDDGCFITMEHVDGESLAARLQRGKLPLAEALAILRDLAAGLAAAHAAGVIHRDLKPSNVLLARDRAIVVDFGIAGERHHLAAGPQGVAGTRGYMAPEQALGGAVDARADVYALGVLAFVLATGMRPPPSVPTHSVLTGGSAAALPVAEITPHLEALPPALGALIESCLAHDPADRPCDAGDVLARLATITAAPRRRTWLGGLAIVALLAAVGLVLAIRRDAARPAPVAIAVATPRIAIAALTTDLAGPHTWIGDSVQRLIVDELVDAWGIEARTGDPARPDWQTVRGTLARDPSGTLHLAIGGLEVTAPNARALATLAAQRLVEQRVPGPARHPTLDELRVAGTADPEAWRWWRRAQRESLMQRWPRATEMCDRALALDPRFPLAALERATINDNKDALASRQLAEATALLAVAPVRPLWRTAATIARQMIDGDTAGAVRAFAEARTTTLDPRERHYIDVRWALALYYEGPAKGATPALELLTETYPEDAAAFKLLAAFHLGSDEPTATTLALRYATRAVELAPDDTGARTDLALALFLVGRFNDARARAAELDGAEPDDKRLASSRLFTLHLALDDPAAAELDARRLLTGSTTQQVEGAARLATLDLYWGRVETGITGLVAAADTLDALGYSVTAARHRVLAARHARMIGDTATAIRELARVARGSTGFAPNAAVAEQLAAGTIPAARTRAAALPDGSVDRAVADLAIAEAGTDPRATLAAFARVEQLSTTTRYLFATGEALERDGRLDEAIAAFTRVTRAPHVEPFASGRAWYRLGVLLERTGDRDGARRAFETVVRRWERSTSRLPELTAARRHLRAL